MAALARALYRRGAEVASAPLVFLSIPIVALFQYPAHILNQRGYLDAGILTNEILAVLAVPLALILILGFSRRRLLPFKRISLPLVFILLGFMLGADLLIDFLTQASEQILPLPEAFKEQLETIMAAPDAQTMMVKIVVLCIVPAVCEEIYFRGFIQRSIEAQWGRGWALLTASVIFAAMHGNIYYFHLYMILGVLFGWVLIVTDTLWAPILCHVVNNCWTFLGHANGLKIPLKDASIGINVVIALTGLVLFILMGLLLRKRWLRRTELA